MQGGICQLCLQPCYRAYEDSWDTTSNPMMAHRAIVHTHTLNKSLLGHFILFVCGLFIGTVWSFVISTKPCHAWCYLGSS